jgi:hypothetical protein
MYNPLDCQISKSCLTLRAVCGRALSKTITVKPVIDQDNSSSVSIMKSELMFFSVFL